MGTLKTTLPHFGSKFHVQKWRLTSAPIYARGVYFQYYYSNDVKKKKKKKKVQLNEKD
jgi:hypothetical protein